MIWKGKQIKTYGDLAKAMQDVENEKEAEEFMEKYREEAPDYAEKNIGYISGYFSQEEARCYSI